MTIGLDAKSVFQVQIDLYSETPPLFCRPCVYFTMIRVAYRHGLSEGLGKSTTASVEPKSEHTQLDCGPDPTSPALRASSASFVKIFFPAMRPDSQAPVI